MSTPTPPDPAQLRTALEVDAIAFRDAALQVVKRWQYVQQVEADLPADLFHDYNLLVTPALVYFGRATQDAAFDFDEALATARRGG